MPSADLGRFAPSVCVPMTYEGTQEVHTLVLGEALTGIPAYR
ncbi:hypothetical protein [Planobispora longispora]|uniref:Uncharacterized protein n=1 Tax=Planobispora longispora TaxID=28887 RepID=A0A8J3RSC7_9ACTN|nr:hypothetical protein [Planobispora longispora]BFE84217.1 hypothetical protein GCM10020093_068180 [Planobispora longispora]GIH79002.1 hypothetical protein Plo01_54310 [Planobispora longispora]